MPDNSPVKCDRDNNNTYSAATATTSSLVSTSHSLASTLSSAAVKNNGVAALNLHCSATAASTPVVTLLSDRVSQQQQHPQSAPAPASAVRVNLAATHQQHQQKQQLPSCLSLPPGFRILCATTNNTAQHQQPLSFQSPAAALTRVPPTSGAGSALNQPIFLEEDRVESPNNDVFAMSSVNASRSLLHSKGLIDFVNASPSPFHAVATARARLESAGFVHLDESQPFDLTKHNNFMITRNASSLIAVSLGGKYQDGNGFTIVGAHTDSPCLKVKPISQRVKEGYHQVGVETYGGGMWFTWFDRDLTVAGRVLVRTPEGNIAQRLVHVPRPIMRIPTLAIHLNRTVNDGFAPNKETHLSPMLCTAVQEELMASDSAPSASVGNQVGKHAPALLRVLAEQLGCRVEDIVDFDLCCADTQPAVIGGALREFVYAPRLDNLFNCYAGVEALVAALPSLPQDSMARVVCLYDNEEVGSRSAQGAMSSMTELVLRRLAPRCYEQSLAHSYLLSVDQAHAAHPNYPEVHEGAHRPAFHRGIVLKTNANQSYATTAVTRALLAEVAARAAVPLQQFVTRQDSGCGSTIGPILAAKLGVPAADVGGPMLSMHSCREMCCTSSAVQTVDLLEAFFTHYEAVRSSILV